MTRAFRDESLLELRDEFGLAGYGAYWIILEMIGEKLSEKDDPILRLSAKNWRNFVSFSPKKFQKFLKTCQKLELFLVEFEGRFITINCPNLLKYRDEWTRKKSKKRQKNSGVSPARRRSKEAEAEAETDVDTSMCTRVCNYISAEPPAPAPEANGDFFTEITLSGDKIHTVTLDDIATWKRSHPMLDVETEVLRCRDWNAANPTRRKTARGISRHINSWLMRAEKDIRPQANSRAHRNASACFNFINSGGGNER